jgi:CheY-like chemotaxis protein
MEESQTEAFRILVVEDSEADARLVVEAVKQCGARASVHVLGSGREALAFCRQEGTHSMEARPHLLLLDMRLPVQDGLETLVEFKRDPALRRIPIIIMSACTSASDIDASYDAHANCYIVKPFDMDRFMDIIRCTVRFWTHTALIAP